MSTSSTPKRISTLVQVCGDAAAKAICGFVQLKDRMTFSVLILVAILGSSFCNAQTFNFNIQLLNLPASGVASGSLQLSWTFDTCAPGDRTARCPGSVNFQQAIPDGLERFVLRRGDFQTQALSSGESDVDLLAGGDPVALLQSGLGGNVYTLPALPTQPDLYSIYMEARDAIGNPVVGISPLFSIGPVANPLVLVTPVTGSVYFTETFDDPYLIRWLYVGLSQTEIPDSFSVDLLSTDGRVASEIYIRSRFNFGDTLLTGFPTQSANWVIPRNLANSQYRLRITGFPAPVVIPGTNGTTNSTTAPQVVATSGVFAIRNEDGSWAVNVRPGLALASAILMACFL